MNTSIQIPQDAVSDGSVDNLKTEMNYISPKRNYFDGMKIGSPHKKLFIIIMLAYFFEQMDNMNFGYVAQAMFNSWGLTAPQANQAMGFILSLYFIGMTLGGFLGGAISDLIGRRKTFLGSIVLFSCSSIVTGLPIDNIYVFAIARALTGFGVFSMMVCSQVYIAEMSPAESRGKWQAMIAAAGLLAMPLIGVVCTLVVPLSAHAWRYIFFLGGTGLIGFAFGLHYLKESPRWLVNQKRAREAEKVLTFFTGQSEDLSKECADVQASSLGENLKDLFSRKYIGRVGMLLAIFLALTPAQFLVFTWLPKLLTTMSVVNAPHELATAFSQREALAMMTIITCGIPFGCLLASRIADLGGRKIPFAACALLASLSCVLFAFAPVNKTLLITLGLCAAAFTLSANTILATYTAEHFPTMVRNTATGTLNGMARLTVALFQSLVPILLLTFGARLNAMNVLNGDIKIIFILCAGLLAFAGVFILIFGDRTGGKSLEDIA